MKKLISLAIVLIMALSLMVPASAAEADTTLTAEQITSAATAVAGALVNANENATVDVSDELISAVIGTTETPQEIADFFTKFIFVEESEVEAVSQKIADSCKYRITTLENGKKTVYVAVDLRTCKDIFDAKVFLNATKKLLAKCEELAIADGMNSNPENYTLMSYNHLAGELALHMILTDFTNDFGANDGNVLLKKWFDMSVVADLNIDENRISPAFIEFIGSSIISIFNLFFGKK